MLMKLTHGRLIKIDQICWADTGFPCYSRGLRSQNIPLITNLWIKREDCIQTFFYAFLRQLNSKSANNQGKSLEYRILATNWYPRRVKTANSEPADNEGRLYSFFLVFALICMIFKETFKFNFFSVNGRIEFLSKSRAMKFRPKFLTNTFLRREKNLKIKTKMKLNVTYKILPFKCRTIKSCGVFLP